MSTTATERATLGGGCFWCLEAAYERLRGVVSVGSGYAGGHVPEPSYEQVSSGTTGHAEVVQIEYDPAEISFRDILEVFFTIHDPTTVDRQGADVGTQYRSIILHHTPEQRQTAEQVIGELEAQRIWDGPIVTQLVPLERFYPAESYHAEYYQRNRNQPYCRIVIDPKLAKLREKHRDKLKVPPAGAEHA